MGELLPLIITLLVHNAAYDTCCSNGVVKMNFLFNVYGMLPCFLLQRSCGRAPIPRKRPTERPEDASLLSNHPFVDKVC